MIYVNGIKCLFWVSRWHILDVFRTSLEVWTLQKWLCSCCNYYCESMLKRIHMLCKLCCNIWLDILIQVRKSHIHLTHKSRLLTAINRNNTMSELTRVIHYILREVLFHNALLSFDIVTFYRFPTIIMFCSVIWNRQTLSLICGSISLYLI